MLPAEANVPGVDEVLAHVDSLTDKELDALPLGMVQLDCTGRILKLNVTEARLSGVKRDRQLGRHFFDEVAPCTRVRAFYGRFIKGVKARSLHESFDFVFRFDHGWRHLVITLFYSEKTDSVWVLLSQTSVTPPPERA